MSRAGGRTVSRAGGTTWPLSAHLTGILFISYASLLGGAERVLLDCAAAVEGRHVLACPEGPLAQAARHAGLTVVPLPRRDLRLRGGPTRRGTATRALIAHARESRRLVRDLDPELTMAWGMRSAIASLALPREVRLAYDHHDFLPGGQSAAWSERRRDERRWSRSRRAPWVGTWILSASSATASTWSTRGSSPSAGPKSGRPPRRRRCSCWAPW